MSSRDADQKGTGRFRPSPSLVISLLALVVATAGSAYAAVMVTGADVQDGSLTGRDVKDGSIRSRDVSGLTAADFKPGELPAAVPGARGPAGDPGAAGARGATGPAGGLLETLPSGVTLRGIYAAQGPIPTTAITFQPPLAALPAHVEFLQPSDPRPAGCPTTNADPVPQASPGWLCIYQTNDDASNGIESKTKTWSRFGVFLAAFAPPGSGNIAVLEGRWAVTAP